MGWLARKYGLQTNSVTAIELVTADGRFVRTDPDHEPDLFWALRGGNGNFGVVTSIEFAVYPVAELYAGVLLFPFERASEVLHAWRGLLGELPDELMTWAALLHFPALPELPDHLRGRAPRRAGALPRGRLPQLRRGARRCERLLRRGHVVAPA
jgi:FAD/FMN-containing dehydrogenase